jgi:hypothetical protein
VIADIDVRFPFLEIFCAVKFIAYESELTEYPAPEIQEKISYNAEARAEHKWQNNSREQGDHENSKYNPHPKDIKPVKECSEKCQKMKWI